MNVDEMVSRYQAGSSLKDIANVTGYTADKVRAALVNAGVTLRARGGMTPRSRRVRSEWSTTVKDLSSSDDIQPVKQQPVTAAEPPAEPAEPPSGRFLTLAEVGRVLNISPSQTYALVRNGQLPSIKIGGRGQWRVEASQLESYIERMYTATAEFVAANPLGRDDEEPN